MKRFNIAEQQQIIFSNIIAERSIYGKFSLDYSRKIYTGCEVVRRKTGETVYTKDGMPKTRKTFKTEKLHTCAIYVIKRTKLYKGHIMCDLLYENAKNWQYDIVLGDSIFSRRLEDFIFDTCDKIGIKFDKHESATIHSYNGLKSCVPKRRKIVTDYTYKARYGYAFDSNVINEETRKKPSNCKTVKDVVRPNTTIVTARIPELKEQVYVVVPVIDKGQAIMFNKRDAQFICENLNRKGIDAAYVTMTYEKAINYVWNRNR